MKNMNRLGLSVLVVLGLSCPVIGGELPRAKPEAAGFSPAKLEELGPAVQKLIDEKKTAGVLTVVARRGKVVYEAPQGMMDIEAGKAMRPDTIFRIYSMTKPVTTVAAMILYDEGRFQLDDPVAKFLPEFNKLRVYEEEGGSGELKRPPTMRDLMRHTAGLTYGAFGNTPVDQQYRQKQVLDRNSSLEEMVGKLGEIPLQYQPGSRFHYSVSVDVLGRAVEVIAGKPLDVFFQERIFKPLDMKDTAFYVPDEKLDRFAANYGPKDEGGLQAIDVPALSPYRRKPGLLSGGGGLVSTGRDYLRFCQMMLNGGELDGSRILRAETVKQMTMNQLGDDMPLSMASGTRPGVGFGLGYSVRIAKSGSEAGQIGEYGWGGAASTHFWISPKDELIVIILQQYMPFNSVLEQKLKPIVYAAIAG